MGNHCTCLNNTNDNNACDLSRMNNQEPNHIRCDINQKTMNVNDDNSATSYQVSMINQDVISIVNNNSNCNNNNKIIQKDDNNCVNNLAQINVNKINELNCLVRGFLFRKRFKNGLKNELIDFERKLYSEYVNTISLNKNVTSILYQQPPNEYLNTSYSDFYENDPTEEIKAKLNQIKKYKNGLIATYSNQNVSYTSLQDCLNNIQSLYKGEVDLYSNTKNGMGELIIRNGDNYYGTWFNNVFTGWNRIITTNGKLLVGLFMESKLNGKGIEVDKDGKEIYKGNFVNGVREGFGEYRQKGSLYEGEFRNGEITGKGKIVFDSGDVYEGEFMNGKFNGKGCYKWKKNGHEYIGDYLNGVFHGKGKYLWSENEWYEGDYVNGIKEGNGELKRPNGKKFICPFLKGKPHGIGIYEDEQHKRYEVEFIEGKINKKYRPAKNSTLTTTVN